MPAKTKLLIIDGNAVVHRSFHGIPPLSNASGEQLNAVYGFAATLLKAWKEIAPTHIVATFDLSGPTFRDELYADYKGTRQETADELVAQFPRVKELVRAFNIPIYEQDGFEADDMIGTITALEPNIDKVILTGDMDTMQLVDGHTRVFTLRKGLSDTLLYDPSAVRERFGVDPDQVIDYKALRGDPSDNIPGVKGIGEKTAAELLQKFHSLDALYIALADNDAKIEEIRPVIREKLLAHKADAFLSQQLATIRRDVPMEFDLAAAEAKQYDRAKVVGLFQELQFTSLLSKLPEPKAPAAQSKIALEVKTEIPHRPDQQYALVNDEATFATFLTEVKKQTSFAVDTETTGLDPWSAQLLGISFSWKDGTGWYVVYTKDRLEALRPILEDRAIEKIGHNMKYDAEILRMQGVTLQPLSCDTMLASYLLNSGSRQHSLDAVVFAEFGYEMMPLDALIGAKGKNQKAMTDVPIELLSWYSCEDADFTWRLANRLRPRLETQAIAGLFRDIEMPVAEVLVDMELAGIKVDEEFLADMAKRLRHTLAGIEKRIYKYADGEFNINSPLQLKEILFEKLKLSTQGIGKTKTGISTAADELEKLKDAHPIIPLITQQRELTKLLTTYIEALPTLVNQSTGRVHTSFNQAVAATGRLSSSNPNLQNIPIRTELGAEIRKAFIAERGFRLISADYSQIELRVIASMAKDEAMMSAFQKGEDIHSRTAANINGISLADVTPQQRRAAKAVNFGIIYGLGFVGLSQSEGISRQEAKVFIEKYFAIHTSIKAWMDNTKKLAHEKGYVETMFGRRRSFPDINSTNHMLAAQAERMAINAPIQGTAADLMKLAMIHVHAGLPKVSAKSRLLLQVHDELIVETPMDEVEKVSNFIKKTMESVATLNVPIVAEVGVGKNWGEAK